MLVSITKSLVKAREKFRLGMKELAIAWSNITINLNGPWKITIGGIDLIIKALTVIDICTTLGKVIPAVDDSTVDATSKQVTMRLKICWLAKYQRPIQVIHDQVPAFAAPPFQTILIWNSIKPVPITIKNLQADAICDRFHDTINNQVHTIFRSNPPQDIGNGIDVIYSAIASTVLLHKFLRNIKSLMFCQVAFTF
jgi:hypothetical protein